MKPDYLSIHLHVHVSIYRAWPHPRVLAMLPVGALAAPVATDARRRGVRVIGGGVHEYVDLVGAWARVLELELGRNAKVRPQGPCVREVR